MKMNMTTDKMRLVIGLPKAWQMWMLGGKVGSLLG